MKRPHQDHAKKDSCPKKKPKIDVKKKVVTTTKGKKKKSAANWDNYYGDEEDPDHNMYMESDSVTKRKKTMISCKTGIGVSKRPFFYLKLWSICNPNLRCRN